jgi:hypothetical protein
VKTTTQHELGTLPISPRSLVSGDKRNRLEIKMPIILWFIGVPLSLIIVLALLGVF